MDYTEPIEQGWIHRQFVHNEEENKEEDEEDEKEACFYTQSAFYNLRPFIGAIAQPFLGSVLKRRKNVSINQFHCYYYVIWDVDECKQ